MIDPDKETLNKLRPGDSIETNDMFEYIFGGYGRNTRLDRKNFLEMLLFNLVLM
jgi:hypothetical protein